MRRCTRTACLSPAVATMTYAYADSTAVLGPLTSSHVPGTFDLCAEHARRTSVPRGWEVIRLPLEDAAPVRMPSDDLFALADAVREIGLRHDDPEPDAVSVPLEPEVLRTAGHLRLLGTLD
ncbi:MAG: DUF3499 domain-containing protein [Propionibacteriaceae bacterium]|nr:DUF3499 domain-containing protein [Propionibacteriaceae bacterium]